MHYVSFPTPQMHFKMAGTQGPSRGGGVDCGEILWKVGKIIFADQREHEWSTSGIAMIYRQTHFDDRTFLTLEI